MYAERLSSDDEEKLGRSKRKITPTYKAEQSRQQQQLHTSNPSGGKSIYIVIQYMHSSQGVSGDFTPLETVSPLL